MENFNQLTAQLVAGFTTFLVVLLVAAVITVFVYMVIQWLKHYKREEYALSFVTLLVQLPKDNEIKVDAAEQMFAGLYSLHKGGFWSFAKRQPIIGFEIVALKEEIAFYVSCPRGIQDLVEKQINGAYPSARIKEVDEVNIFNEGGRVAFKALKLSKPNYYPIQIYKDLPTDGLSLITSALSKMQSGEGGILQILLQPTGKSWQKKGKKIYKQRKKARG